MRQTIVGQMKLYQELHRERARGRFICAVCNLSDEELDWLDESKLAALLEQADVLMGKLLAPAGLERQSTLELQERVKFLRRWCQLELVQRARPASTMARA